ncbi:hypothetical protein KY290_011538 [Solanum tuberosum]|uniref:Uncharacterized protein n=1 Tax=Solanum tuberosum TaxID=4113 RepID=A0ABQ7W0Y6_SOLTU|nr:hypothetical protein KY290_011538 [Solanum tuberosum]
MNRFLKVYLDGASLGEVRASLENLPGRSSTVMAQPSEHLSFRGYNALGLQVNSSFFSFWLPGKEAGGTLCNLGYLSSLVELNLCGNGLTNIPAARISDLTDLLAPSSPWTWLIQLWNNMLKDRPWDGASMESTGQNSVTSEQILYIFVH